jgi:hypothetical protein
VKGIQGHIVASYMLILLMEPTMDRFDAAIVAIANLDASPGRWI